MPPRAARSKPRRSGDGGRQPRAGLSAQALVLRALPALVVPCLVASFEIFFVGSAQNAALMVGLALTAGVAIAISVANIVVSAALTTATVMLLMSLGYLQELQFEGALGAQGALAPVASSAVVAGAPGAPLASAVGSADASAGASAGASPGAAEALAPTTMETLSVVLPCAYEGEFAAKTVRGLQEHTKRGRLKEIIVVDDGSEPRLEMHLPETSLRGSKWAPVRMIRHEKTLGLIAAKKTGGDAAEGDVVVFFDCHVKPRDGWEEAFLKQMRRAGDHRTVVVPTITSLDPDTWEENSFAAASKACYMTWNGDFTWLATPGRDVPLMSGGLLAMSRRWWQETEGYDPEMVAWGGENIDQSFRIWLCGGRIEVAEGAYVAHMWRDPGNPKTQLKYPMPTEAVMRNKARAVSAWMQEFTAKPMSFPEYEDIVSGLRPLGDMSNFDRLRKKLQCAPFSHYLQRFSYVYLESGLIPPEVFQLRDASTGLCIERVPHTRAPHPMALAPCAGGESVGGVSELQLWHPSNWENSKRQGDRCCSGLNNWNFLQCMGGGGIGARLETFECEITGHGPHQHLVLQESGPKEGQITWQNGNGCLAPEVMQERDRSADEAPCLRVNKEDEDGFGLRRDDGMCLTAIKQTDEGGFRVEYSDCGEPLDASQRFTEQRLESGVVVKVVPDGGLELCLDAASGTDPLLYPCYDSAAPANPNQHWHLTRDIVVWEGQTAPEGQYQTNCLKHVGDGIGLHKIPSARIVLRTCTAKRGQRFQRVDVRQSPEGETFLLRDAELDKCLGSTGDGAGALERPLKMGDCDQRWVEMKNRDQVMHLPTRFCIDAGDEETPILYPCHEPKAQRKQRFFLGVDEPGSVRMYGGWEDNGRVRFFERCLDHSPQRQPSIVISPCSEVQSAGVRWEKLGAFKPMERELWEKASTLPPGALGLGGGAAPP